jgi:hypothetical protein
VFGLLPAIAKGRCRTDYAYRARTGQDRSVTQLRSWFERGPAGLEDD